MSRNLGDNNGMTGLLNLPADGTPVPSNGSFLLFSGGMSASVRDRIAYGSNGTPSVAINDPGGRWKFKGEVRHQGAPSPDKFQNVSGNIVLQQDSVDSDGSGAQAYKVTFAAKVCGVSISKGKGENVWNVELEAVSNGNWTWTWNGKVYTTSAPSHDIARTYEGSEKKIDPQDLEPGASVRFDVLGVAADTDAGDVAEIAAVVAAMSTPITHTKYRIAQALRPSSNSIIVTITFAPRNTKDDIEMPGTSVTTDPEGIESKGRVTKVDGTPTVPSGFVAVVSTNQTLSDWHTTTATEIGLQTTRQAIENQGTESTRASRSPFTFTDVDVINSTDTTENIATVAWSAFQSNLFAEELEVMKLNPSRAKVTYKWLNPGTLVISSLFGEPRWVPARVSGGNIQVWAGRVLDIGGGKKAVFVCRNLINTPIRLISIVRRAAGTTVPDHAELVNTVNDDTFLGRPAGEIFYKGADNTTNLELSGTRPFQISFKFVNDLNGIFDFKGFISGWFYTTASPTAGTWVNASSLTGTGLVGVLPDQEDFDVFTAIPLV